MNLDRSALLALLGLALGAGGCTSDRRQPVPEAALRDHVAALNAEAAALVERAKAMPAAAQIGEPPAPKARPVAAKMPPKLALRDAPVPRRSPWDAPPGSFEPARFAPDFLVRERRFHQGFEPAFAFLPAMERIYVEPAFHRPAAFRVPARHPHRASFRPPPPRFP